MSEIPKRQVKDDNGALMFEPISEGSESFIQMERRIMTAEEIIERDEAYRINTAEAIAARAAAGRAQINGHANNRSHD